MIEGLPQKFSTSILRDFQIGHQEAVRDEVLEYAFCETGPVRLFLAGDKDFLIGVKGSGKSAIFKQLTERRIHFENKSQLRQVLVPIDQDIDYLSVKAHLSTALESAIVDEDVRMRFIWEIYVLYRLVSTVFEEGFDISDQDREILNPIVEYFSFDSIKPSILDIFTKANRTFGCKLDVSATGFPVPDFYIKSEPPVNTSKVEEDVRIVTLNISEIQTRVNAVLRQSKAVAFVLIDNIDDFLAREEYEAQRLVIQGLLGCIKDYSRHEFIRVKGFIRNEVFHKVDFELLGGAEKIVPNAVTLEWSDSDIRRFLAERFLFNMHNLLGIDRFSISIEEGDLKKRKWITKYLPRRVLNFIGIDDREALDVTERDFVCRQIITTFMPRQVQHFDGKGHLENGLDLFDFIDSHFCLANSKTTPRAMLIYLHKLVEISTAYWDGRMFPDITMNEEKEYPIFQRQHVLLAYGMLQIEIVSYISSAVTHPEWKDRINSLLTNIGQRGKFSFRDLKRLIDYDDSDQDAKELLAFLEHLGVLVCNNKSVHLPDREYQIPVLLQKNWVKEKGDGL